MTQDQVLRAIDVDKVQIVDYLSGEDAYKKNWMSHHREYWGIAAFNPLSVRGLMQIARQVVGRSAKQNLMTSYWGRRVLLTAVAALLVSATPFGAQTSASISVKAPPPAG